MSFPTLVSAMTPFPYTVDATANLDQASDMMMAQQIRHLPVVRDGRLFGIIARREIDLAMAVMDARNVSVESVATSPARVYGHDTRLDQVTRDMAQLHLDAVLVSKHEKLVGIVTTVDICRVLAELLAETYPHKGDAAA